MTIHQQYKLPDRSLLMARPQNSLNGVNYIIHVNKFSMLSQVTFGYIDWHSKQTTGLSHNMLRGK